MNDCKSLYIGIGASALANVVIGSVWYGLIFGPLYQRHLALKGIAVPTDSGSMLWATLESFIAALVIAAVMACFMKRFALTSPKAGFNFGWMAWLGFVAPVTVQGVIYAKWPLVLYLINSGYNLVALIAMGVILSYAVRRCKI